MMPMKAMKPFLWLTPAAALLGGLLMHTAHAEDESSALPAPPSFASPRSFASDDGAFLYRAACQGCHMEKGQGASGAGTYPALANNPRLASAQYPAVMIINGNRAMPAFGGMLSDEQVANLVNYLRTHFGNDFDTPITADEIKGLRP